MCGATPSVTGMESQTRSAPDALLDPTPEPDHRRTSDDDGRGLVYPFPEIPAPGEAMPIADGILWIRMPLPWSLDHINLYLLADGEGWLILDSGVRSPETMSLWETHFAGSMAGRPATRIFITHHHPDHIGLAGWLSERFDAPLAMSRSAFLLARTLTLDIRDTPPEEVLRFSRRAGFSDAMIEKQKAAGWGHFARGVHRLPIGHERVADGARIRIGGADWHAIETAGHAPGHLVLYSPERRILLSGDQVLPEISSNVSVYPTEPHGNPLGEWLDGLARLLALPEDTLVLPSHNRPFRGLHRRLEALIAKHLDRLGGIIDLARECPRTAIEVFPALFRRRVSGLEFAMATGEAIAHLHFLEALGALVREERDGVARFRPAAPFDPAAERRRLHAVTEKEREDASWAV